MDSKEATFPILRSRPGYAEICGTGFFVGKDGRYVTCSHTFEAVPKADYFAVTKGPTGTRVTVPLGKITMMPKVDLALGTMDAHENVWLTLTEVVPERGHPITTIGYDPMPIEFEGSLPPPVKVEAQTRTGDALGKLGVADASSPPDPRWQAVPIPKSFDGFFVRSDRPHPGHSGGPMVDASGRVVAIYVHYRDDVTVDRVPIAGTDVGVLIKQLPNGLRPK